MDDYTLADHRHRFAAWAASRAASTSPKCRFSVRLGVELIECVQLRVWGSWVDLPEPTAFSQEHTEMRVALVSCASRITGGGKGREFSHGVAAKLINCYLKAIYLADPAAESLSEEFHAKLNAIHPPIDSLLLKELCNHNVGGKGEIWLKARKKGWSNFESEDYCKVIDAIADVTKDKLWKIEKYWLGYQEV